MIDIDLGKNKILSLDPKRIIAIGDKQFSNGCTVYIDGMEDLNLSCTREEFLENLKQYYERKYNSKGNSSSSGILDDNTDIFLRWSCERD